MHADRPTVLVVDDEFLVRLTVCDFLDGCGFATIAAADAAEAIDILSSGRRVDVVFTDLQMPGALDGIGLAQWISGHRPGLRVILTSGHHQKAREAQALCQAEAVLPKPVSFEQLRQLLGDAAEPS